MYVRFMYNFPKIFNFFKESFKSKKEWIFFKFHSPDKAIFRTEKET